MNQDFLEQLFQNIHDFTLPLYIGLMLPFACIVMAIARALIRSEIKRLREGFPPSNPNVEELCQKIINQYGVVRNLPIPFPALLGSISKTYDLAETAMNLIAANKRKNRRR